MNSYSHFTDREEFLQKFRQDQGLAPMHNNNTRQNTNRNMNMNNSLNNLEGRWEYLYRLEQLKRSKLEEQRKVKAQELFEKDLGECTFTPKLNTNKSHGNLLRPKTAQSPTYTTNINTNIPTQTDNVGNNLQSYNLLNRQQLWNYKRSLKIENIKQNQMNLENQECKFKPKLNSPNKINKVEISKPSKNLLVDPESYSMYINRQSKHRENIKSKNNRKQTIPGSGQIWTNKITKPKTFNLSTEGNITKPSIIKSISKPLTPKKFTTIKNNYKAGDGRIEKKNQTPLSELLYSKREESKYEELEEKNRNGFKFDERIEFQNAVKTLHNELLSLDLLGYEA